MSLAGRGREVDIEETSFPISARKEWKITISNMVCVHNGQSEKLSFTAIVHEDLS